MRSAFDQQLITPLFGTTFSIDPDTGFGQTSLDALFYTGQGMYDRLGAGDDPNDMYFDFLSGQYVGDRDLDVANPRMSEAVLLSAQKCLCPDA